VTSPAAVIDEVVMTKIDAILSHLSDMSGYLKNIVEETYEMGADTLEGSDTNIPVGEDGIFEISDVIHDVDIHSTPPLSATSPRESLTRLSSPLSSPSPSPNPVESNQRRDSIVPVSLVIPTGLSAGGSPVSSAVLSVVVDPLHTSPPRSHVTPNVNLIQPTPNNSQSGLPITQLHPTPHRTVPDSTTDVSPAVASVSNSQIAPAVSQFSLLNASPALIPPVPLVPATARSSPSPPMPSSVLPESHPAEKSGAEKSGLVTSIDKNGKAFLIN